ncbi:MAG: hypothetical protein ACLU9T_15890 [Blautia faecis]
MVKLICTEQVTIQEMDIYLIRFLEIQYLLSGYFPDVVEQNYWIDDNKFVEEIKQISGYVNATARNTGFLYSVSLKVNSDFHVFMKNGWKGERK